MPGCNGARGAGWSDSDPMQQDLHSPSLPLARRRWLQQALLCALPGAAPHAWAQAGAASPPGPACLDRSDWPAFAARHLQADGRIVDFDTPRQQSTSESQSYGLFFSLVHGDRAAFRRILDWTVANLCDGQPDRRLPAWQWGRRDDGGWGVIDANPASDADLWIAYALLEAGRLWQQPAYTALARQMLVLVIREEVVRLPGLGAMLLPWPRSVGKGPVWRLNASYMPLPLLRRLAAENPAGPWSEIAQNTVRMVAATSPHGFVPDWCAWSEARQAFVTDPEKGAEGSYDAIRVYLWAGMTATGDTGRAPLLHSLYGPRALLQSTGRVAERVDTATGTVRGDGPPGFSAALLPYLRALGHEQLVQARLAFVNLRTAAGQPLLPYYERMLLLFGRGWLEGHFAFDASGRLQPNPAPPCPANA